MCKYKLNKTGNVCTMNVTISRVRANTLENKNITYLEVMFVALFVQHVVHMGLLSSVSSETVEFLIFMP
jgi:hypothetical protein